MKYFYWKKHFLHFFPKLWINSEWMKSETLLILCTTQSTSHLKAKKHKQWKPYTPFTLPFIDTYNLLPQTQRILVDNFNSCQKPAHLQEHRHSSQTGTAMESPPQLWGCNVQLQQQLWQTPDQGTKDPLTTQIGSKMLTLISWIMYMMWIMLSVVPFFSFLHMEQKTLAFPSLPLSQSLPMNTIWSSFVTCSCFFFF